MESGIEIVTGTFLLVFGVSFLIHARFWSDVFRRMSSDTQQVFTLLVVLLICGLLSVRGHNLWVRDWRVIVTIVGWAVMLKSIALILAPQILRSYASWSDKTMMAWLRVGSVLWTFGGAVILYFCLHL